MECELCGRNAQLARVEIEGSILSVCGSCAQLGRRLEVTAEIREKKPPSLDTSSIDPNFSKRIRDARSKSGLSIEQLGKKINEKTAVLERVERGMRPTDDLAKKLEKTLKIKLLGFEE